MSPAFWTSLILLLNSGKPEEYHLRHERKRLHAGRRVPETRGRLSSRLQESAALPFRKISRPLFSWDPPAQAPPPVSPVSHRDGFSGFEPAARRNPQEPKPLADHHARADPGRAFPRSSPGGASIAFRNSYVHKTDPSADATLGSAPSRKIYRIVYGASRKAGRKGAVPPGRKYGAKGGRCRDGAEACFGTGKNGIRRLSKGHPQANRQRFGSGYKWKRKKTAGEDFGVRRTCKAMTETCDHICVEENGRAACMCHPGYHLVGGFGCVDVDECKVNNGGCEGTCINTPGSRRCTCPRGFRLSPVGGRCLDVNECLPRNGRGPCQDKCTNTDGGYFCGCDGVEGTVLAADNHTCEEARGCGPGSAGCSHTCINTFGKAFCTCPDGYELGEDWKTCHDVDECSDGGNCDSECVNTVGSFRCKESDAEGYAT